MPKIDITIRRNRPVVIDGEPPKGIIPPGKPPDYWPRRPTGRIQFYDLGQLTDGAGGWITNDFKHESNPVVVGFVVGSDDPLTLADYQELENEILAIGVENFTSSYRRIEKSRGTTFDIRVKGTDAEVNNFAYWMPGTSEPTWTAQGLKLSEAERTGPTLTIVDGFPEFQHIDGQFLKLEINDRAVNKVTAEPSVGAASVDFTLSNTAKIFLMPAVTLNWGGNGGTPGVLFNFINYLRPRTDDPDARFIYDNPANPPEQFDEVVAHSAALGPTRTFTVSGGGFAPGGSFTDEGPGAFVYFFFNPDTSNVFDGQLTGVIKQGGQFYYFWKL